MGMICFNSKKNYNKDKSFLEKIRKYFCIIQNENKKEYSIGILCKIFPFENKILPLIITNSKILKNNNINESKKINLNFDKNNIELYIDNSRIIHFDQKYDIAIIEINKEDNIKMDNFLEIETHIYQGGKDIINDNNNLSLVYINSDYKIDIFSCKIKEENNNNEIFEYLCKSENNNIPIGYPIVISKNYENLKILGLNIEKNEKTYNYQGIFINKFIQKLIEKKNINKNSLSNEILNDSYNIEQNYIDEISMQYKIDNEEESIRIFGDEFVNNNKNICTIIVNGKEQKLFGEINKKDIKLNKDNIFEIKLKGISKVTNFSSIFAFCYTLLKISDLNFNTNNVTDLSNMFCRCESLKSLPSKFKWNTNKVTDISGLFSGCSSLTSLPDISKWDTSNVKDMNSLFSGCSSLNKLPDLSKWNTGNVTNMNNLFSQCPSLFSLSDISKWNVKNVTNMSNMFSENSSLTSLPDISRWNIQNLINITRMFYKCSSLKTLPDISKWNIKNIKHINSLFEECSSLSSLPNISKWNTDNITSLYRVFSGCSCLKTLPDISKWNTKNVTDMSNLFSGCSSLVSLPDISKWNTHNVTDMSSMFEGCSSLKLLPNISNWNIKNVTYLNDMFEGCNPELNIPSKFKQ